MGECAGVRHRIDHEEPTPQADLRAAALEAGAGVRRRRLVAAFFDRRQRPTGRRTPGPQSRWRSGAAWLGTTSRQAGDGAHLAGQFQNMQAGIGAVDGIEPLDNGNLVPILLTPPRSNSRAARETS